MEKNNAVIHTETAQNEEPRIQNGNGRRSNEYPYQSILFRQYAEKPTGNHPSDRRFDKAGEGRNKRRIRPNHHIER